MRKGPAASPAPPARDGRGEKTADRLEAAADKIAQAAADLTKAEAALQKKIAAAAREREKPKPAPEPPRSEPAPEPPAPAEPSPPPPAPPAAAEPALPGPEIRAAEAEAAAVEVSAAAPVTDPAPAAEPEPPAEPPPPRKPRAPRKPKPEAAPAPVQEELAPEFSQLAPEEAAPVAAVSADGATRLLVTAYIGIGNRLFIRGEGPGLSWDEGVPLQFVSIGKWRWETPDAAAPVSFKLYKNDETECAALGERTLEPGQQLEVSATF